MTSVDNYQEEVQSTRSGPGSRPGSVNSIRSVTIKSRSRSSIGRPESILNGAISEHGDASEQGSMAISEGASEHGDEVGSEGQRSASRVASSHRESWPEGGSDGEVLEEEGELLDPSRPNSSRRSRHSSARRSASLKERSRSHMSAAMDEAGKSIFNVGSEGYTQIYKGNPRPCISHVMALSAIGSNLCFSVLTATLARTNAK